MRRVDARTVVWLPLRANAGELGALVGISSRQPTSIRDLDTAAVLAAHVAASLDAALALQRERLSAVTDPLTRILNRRGLEERLEHELATAQERRLPLSLLVIDCDDFKEINDRAGHEFGDALLREVADVLVAVAAGGRRGRPPRRRRVRRDASRVPMPTPPRRSAGRSGRCSPKG